MFSLFLLCLLHDNYCVYFFYRQTETDLLSPDVVVQGSKPKLKDFRDGMSSMIMDVKMPPHYHFRKGNNNMHDFDLSEIARQLSSINTATSPKKLMPLIIQQKNNPRNVINNQIQNLATFFSSDRDTVDYGYSLDSKGKPMTEDVVNFPDEYGGMNTVGMSTETPTETATTEVNKVQTDTESTEIFKFAFETEPLEFLFSTPSYELNVSIHLI